MTPIEQQLLRYDDLSPSEREEVERHVQAHPEWEPLLAEAQALHALLQTVRSSGDTPDTAALADYVLARALGAATTPERATRHTAVEAALASDPALERQAHAISLRLAQLTTEAEDPIAQFERLTGRRLSPLAGPNTGTADARILPWHPLRLALAACLALGALYGALALAGRLAQPERALLADLDALPGDYGGLHLRGEDPADRASDQYAMALDALREARTSTLGLFPAYDDAALDAVAGRLREVLEASGAGSWEHLEALYALGRIRFYQGRDEEAAQALQSVVVLEGPHASDARRLLDYLQGAQQEGAE